MFIFSHIQDRKNLLKEFTNGSAQVLVCTDIASRGIDSTKVSNYSLCLSLAMKRKIEQGMTRMHTHTHTRTHTHTHTQVTHVVLFDFPNTIVDYLHRVGRTGRVGSQAGCKTTAFMTHKRDVRVAWKIKVSRRQSTNWTELKHDHSRSLICGLKLKRYNMTPVVSEVMQT